MCLPNHVRSGRASRLKGDGIAIVGGTRRKGPPVTVLVSERVGQLFVDGDRIEYTEYGAGDRWVVLVHGQLMPRRMHEPLARLLAGAGFHVVAPDLLGHGRSDRPLDPKGYSMTAFGEQVVALLDHLEADQAVIGGTSMGANVALEVADAAPGRVRGLLLEMPVLDNALEAGLVAFGPLMFAARFLPASVALTRRLTRTVPRRAVPFWAGIALDTLDQQPAAMAAAIHGIFFGRIAPSSKRRRTIEAAALVVGHPRDPVHPAADAAMLAQEMPHARFVAARSIVEWRTRPRRLNAEAVGFATECWARPSPRSDVG
jgi:pimeloyl-ACP methyl ester carboxylesterase